MKHKAIKLSILFLFFSMLGVSKDNNCKNSIGCITSAVAVKDKVTNEPKHLPMWMEPGNCMLF